MKLEGILERFGCEVTRETGVGYRVTYKDRQMIVTDELLLSIGTSGREYTHSLGCAYHTDNYDYDSWRLPYPPTCDCPYKKLKPTTEQDIMNMVVQSLRLGR